MSPNEVNIISSEYDFWLDKITKNKNLSSVNKIKKSLDIIDSVNLVNQNNKIIALATAITIHELQYDNDMISTAILMYLPNKMRQDLNEKVGPKVSKLLSGVSLMNLIDQLSNKSNRGKAQRTNIHKLLIAMVNHPRVIVIKLAEQYCKLLDTLHIWRMLVSKAV